jgi:ubiquinol-cytochrome c reductase cytochrome c subunit
MRSTYLQLFWAAVIPAIVGSSVGSFAQSASGDAAAGKTVFRSAGCYECHGYNGHGASATGPRIASPAPPFMLLRSAVRNPRNVMPAYAPEVLDDAALQDIFAYLQSQPRSPPAAELSHWLE